MKKIFAISGSASENSSNAALLQVIKRSFEGSYQIEVFEGLQHFPLFSPQLQEAGVPESVQEFKQKVVNADSVIICTPEYLHNIPAALKNALEWMTISGELSGKSMLPITFTPAPTRGEYAMISLLQTLKACNAKIVTELPLYRNQLTDEQGNIHLDKEHRMLLGEALGLL
ncbi:MAG: NAD(P)H-dependent oxidoreductase [Flavobacteriales bacterium]|nr:NAD(P)H-dependent oxidoreductase [Flavobacteriales bacterium]